MFQLHERAELVVDLGIDRCGQRAVVTVVAVAVVVRAV
jgi:hypothetical protein